MGVSQNEERTSAAKAALQMMGSGTAEAVPLSKAGVCDLERLHGRESEEKADGLAVAKTGLPFDYAQGQDDTFMSCNGQLQLQLQTATAKTKCGGLSTAQQTMKLSVAPVEMTQLLGWVGVTQLWVGQKGFPWIWGGRRSEKAVPVGTAFSLILVR